MSALIFESQKYFVSPFLSRTSPTGFSKKIFLLPQKAKEYFLEKFLARKDSQNKLRLSKINEKIIVKNNEDSTNKSEIVVYTNGGSIKLHFISFYSFNI